MVSFFSCIHSFIGASSVGRFGPYVTDDFGDFGDLAI